MSAISRGLAFEPETDIDRLAAMVTHICRMMGIDPPEDAIDGARPNCQFSYGIRFW